MREIKLTVNGKEIKLTDKQMEKLGFKKDTNPFERIEDKKYYYIKSDGEIDFYFEGFDSIDNTYYLIGNRCNDKDLMLQRVKKETLDRLLWRFSIENGGSNDLCEVWDEDEDENTIFYYIEYNYFKGKYEIHSTNMSKGIGTTYFVSKEVAERAIDEILLPFERRELEVCKIWEE